MNDDLLKRLRDAADDPGEARLIGLIREAADELERLDAHDRKLQAEHTRHSLQVAAQQARADAAESRAVHAERQLKRWCHWIDQYEQLAKQASEGQRAMDLEAELRRQNNALERYNERLRAELDELRAKP